MKEHQNNIKFGRFNAALPQLHKKKIMKIDFENVRKKAQYSNKKYGLLHETLKILRDAGACNHIENAKIHLIWQLLMGESHDQGTDKKEDMIAGSSVTDD